jgi:pimeloyl-ACP methyl ester carboxylesterase/quercetin dioxygenase-like cupin family protein
MPTETRIVTRTNTTTVSLTGLGDVQVTYTERGSGQPVLLLHGGAGAFSVAAFADLLASSGSSRVITPVHPGFDGTPRPAELASIASLAGLYGQLLRDLRLSDVCVIGNSIGGWIAAELALAESAAPDRRVSSVVLVDAAGLQIDDAPIPDFFSLTLDQVFDLSYFDPDAFRIDPATLTPERVATQAANRSALQAYAGTKMTDPSLLRRLPGVRMPALVVWGAADRMVPPEHGKAYAEAIPGGQFRLIAKAGHLPQLETPDELLAAVTEFAAEQSQQHATSRSQEGAVVRGISIVQSGEGERVLAGPVQLRILEDGSTTSHRLGIVEITIAPHTAGPPQHRHARHDEGFYVVSGTAQFTVGEQTYEAEQGTLVMIPPGAPHTFANASDRPAVLLNTFTPDFYVQYFRDLRDLAASGQPPGPQVIGQVMARYATEPATTFAGSAGGPAGS